MHRVLLKFVEVFTRAAFVVGTSYSLALSGAGRFGIAVTLVGLFAFAFNWERQVDIQRRYVDAPPEIFDRAVMAALPFWGFNQAVMMPFFLLACWWLAELSAWQLLLAAAIVSCEHVANQTYQMALISRRYWQFLYIVAGKNIAVLFAVLPYILFAPSQLTLDYVLEVWALGQILCAAIVFVILWRVTRAAPHEAPFSFGGRILSQHRDSFTHFQIGAIAIVMLQYDRLMVGALLPEEVGVYFRHILIVSFVYQFFNVASYNPVMPQIFALAKRAPNAVLLRRLARELAMVGALVVSGVVAAVAIDYATAGAITEKYHLSVALGLILLIGAMLRVTADFGAMICNARMAERYVLGSQIAAFAIGAPALALLTIQFGLFGAAVATVVASASLLALIGWSVFFRIPQAAK